MPRAPVARKWRLVWRDEFGVEGLPDAARWNFQTNCNRWLHDAEHGELQEYTRGRAENARVSGGRLRITAVREPFAGQNFTSARLHTHGKGDWRYGRVEVCAKLPQHARGLWPAIWLLPSEPRYGEWPRSGEIDICEHVGWQPRGQLHASVHTQRYNHRAQSQVRASTVVASAHDRFHVYALEWRHDGLRVFVDNVCFGVYEKERGAGPDEWPFDDRFYLLLNIAVGGSWGGLHGVDEAAFPASMEVAYVRVFEEARGEADPEPPPPPAASGKRPRHHPDAAAAPAMAPLQPATSDAAHDPDA